MLNQAIPDSLGLGAIKLMPPDGTSGGISLMAPKPKLFYSDITKAKLVSFTQIGLFYLPIFHGV